MASEQLPNEFSLSTVLETQSLCNPFLKEYNLATFNYARYYHSDGSLLAMHSERGFAELYLELNCSPIAPIPFEYWLKPSFYYLPKTGTNEEYKLLLSETSARFNCDNPLYCINQYENFAEIVVFTSYLNDENTLTRYLNILPFIKQFINYFSHQVTPILRQGQDKRLFLPKNLAPDIPFYQKIALTHQAYNLFTQQLFWSAKIDPGCLMQLSKREIQCLYHIHKGCSHKDIARELAISVRTVEKHVNNAKHKAGIHTSTALIKILSNL